MVPAHGAAALYQDRRDGWLGRHIPGETAESRTHADGTVAALGSAATISYFAGREAVP